MVALERLIVFSRSSNLKEVSLVVPRSSEMKLMQCLRIKGVENYDVSLENQLVHVTGTIPYDELLKKLEKTGKEVRCFLSPCCTADQHWQVRSGKTIE